MCIDSWRSSKRPSQFACDIIIFFPDQPFASVSLPISIDVAMTKRCICQICTCGYVSVSMRLHVVMEIVKWRTNRISPLSFRRPFSSWTSQRKRVFHPNEGFSPASRIREELMNSLSPTSLQQSMNQVCVRHPHGPVRECRYVFIAAHPLRMQSCSRGSFSLLPSPWRHWQLLHSITISVVNIGVHIVRMALLAKVTSHVP